MLDHLAEFLGRAGPCCVLSPKPEEARLSYWPLASGPLSSGVSILGCARLPDPHTSMVFGCLVTSFLNFPLVHSCSPSRARLFHRQDQRGPDGDTEVLWHPTSPGAAPSFRTVWLDLPIRHRGQRTLGPQYF